MSHRSFKIILSRKGFDSASGGCASPIFPNGRLYSIPITYAQGATKQYRDLLIDAGDVQSSLGYVVEQLTGGRVSRDSMVHFDPDLDELALPRRDGWRCAFGQAETAQVHLANQSVGAGDVFLFHGWFRAVEYHAHQGWRYRPDAPNLSVIFGWLQVGAVIDVAASTPAEVLERYPWLADHPHVRLSADVALRPPANTIYVASERMTLGGSVVRDIPGAGVFRTLAPRLVLTDPRAKRRSVWLLPRWFLGGSDRSWLTQFPRPEWWTDTTNGVIVRPVGRQGQEAVLDCSNRPDAAAWVASLFRAQLP